MPFRTVHAYGVFPPRMGPPVKFLPIVEGTRDGEHWETFEYRYMPSTEHSPPKFVASHCPRLDHWMLYEGYGIGSGNYLGTLFSQGSAYDFSSVSTMDRLLERVMDRESPTRRLFRVVPFDGEPPVRARMRLYVFAPTTRDEMKATGRYWHRDLVGDHLPERAADPTLYERWLPRAEQLHPDDRFARRRVARIRPLLGAQTHVLALEDALGVSLFQRSSGGARPTGAGERFLTDVERALELLTKAAVRAGAAGRGEVGRLRLGHVWPLTAGPAAGLLRAYRLSAIDVELELRAGSAAELVAAVLDRELDALLIDADDTPPGHDHLTLWSEPWLLARPQEAADEPLNVAFIRPLPALSVELTTVPFASGRVLTRFAVKAGPELSTLPRRASVVIVIDASRSMADDFEQSARSAIEGYLAHLPDASVQLLTFDRRVRQVLDGFRSVEAARASANSRWRASALRMSCGGRNFSATNRPSRRSSAL